MTDRSWDPIDDLFGDSSDVVSNSFNLATDTDNKLFNEDELDQNELLGIEEDQQSKDYDDFGLDTNEPASAESKLEPVVSPVPVRVENDTQKTREKSPESIGRSTSEAFFEEELEKMGPVETNRYTDLNYEEPDYDNLLGQTMIIYYDEEDDLNYDARQRVSTEAKQQKVAKVEKPLEVVIEKPAVAQLKEPEIEKEPSIVVNKQTSENKIQISDKEDGLTENLAKRSDIEEDDQEDEDEDEDGLKKKRGRSNYWSERGEKSPSTETESGTIPGNQNLKGYNNNNNNINNINQRNNGRQNVYQNVQNNRSNNNMNNRNNYLPNNFINNQHNGYNNMNVNGKFQHSLGIQNVAQNNALLPLPNMSNFNSNQNQMIKPFSQGLANPIRPQFPIGLNNTQFQNNSLLNNQMTLNPNENIRGRGQLSNFNTNLPQIQSQPRPNVPIINSQQSQAFNPGFNMANNIQHIIPGFNQQQPQTLLPNNGFINQRTDLPIQTHHVPPIMNNNFNPQTNNSPNQFQSFNNGPINNTANRIPNFSQPGLLPTPLVQPPQFQNHLYQHQPPMNNFINPGPSAHFHTNQIQPVNQFIQPSMMQKCPQVNQPMPQQQQIKPSTVYLNPSFIAKQKKLEEAQSQQKVLKEMSFQNKGSDSSNTKSQRSRDLDALLEKRIADEMGLSTEKIIKSKLNSNIITPSFSATKRKSYENDKDRKSSSHNRIDPSDKVSTNNSKSSPPPAKKIMSKVVTQPKTSSVQKSSESTSIIVDDPDYAKKIEEQKRKREEILKMKEEKRNQRIKEASTGTSKPEVLKQNVNNSPPARDTRSVVVSTKSTVKRVLNSKPVVIS